MSIDQRPEGTNQREAFSLWKIDTILLMKGTNECLLAFSKHQTRFETVRLIPDKSA
ncbi:MAG TPA: hypothetical protein VGC17_01320 [Lactovum miscens]